MTSTTCPFRLEGFDGLEQAGVPRLVATLDPPSLNAMALIALAYLAALGRCSPLQVEAIIGALGNGMVKPADVELMTSRALEAVEQHNRLAEARPSEPAH